ncbi:MAG: ATP-binding protein [Candidatus Celaenobacter polaris]|nr:ATP-binding protein [Candidatus Celaenobacter polaris]
MENILYQYNPWWENEFIPKGIKPRDIYLNKLRKYQKDNVIILVTGLRRVGKTSLLKLYIRNLIENDVKPQHILYVSLDDYLLKKNTILDIVENYRRIIKINLSEHIYLFFDEITYKEDYHQQLKNLYDHQNITIFASASSSSLLQDKKAYLTGRSVALEIQPLFFHEYLQFRDIHIKKSESYLLESYFKDYMRDGGMPENVLNPDRGYLINLVDDIIEKDIVAFYGIKNHQKIKDYFSLLMERSGKQVSINKIRRILEISPDTSKRYLSYFEKTYLIHLISRYGTTNERLLSPKKVYACDLGIKYLFIGDRDLGSYFENYVYMNIRNSRDIYYLYQNGIEVDFITSDKILIETKYHSEMNEKQKKLFQSYPANKRLIVNDIQQVEKLREII